MINPSNGVNPIDVSIDRPSLIAHIEQPLPRCILMILEVGWVPFKN